MKSSPPQGESRTRQWVKAAPMIAIVVIVAVFMAVGVNSSTPVSVAQPSHHTKPALAKAQESMLDPGANDTDNDLLTNPHIGHGKTSAHRLSDAVSVSQLGKAIVQALPPTRGGIWRYMPELPAGFYPIHTIVMTRGVLLVAGSGNSEQNHNTHIYKTYYCNPVLQGCRSIPTPTDLFCGDMLQLEDGSTVMAGGTALWGSKGWRGAKWIYQFRENTLRWSHVANTKLGRWYPTTVLQTNGKVLIISGLDQNGKLAKKTERSIPRPRRSATPKESASSQPMVVSGQRA